MKNDFQKKCKSRLLSLAFLGLMGSLSLLTSCSSVQSGHYVQVGPQDSIDKIATRYNVTKDRILAANLDRDISEGEWIFIPKNVGFYQRYFGEETDGTSSSADDVGSAYTGKLLWPVPGSQHVSSVFGKRGRRLHQGIDIPAPRGSHILASEDGIVTFSGRGLRGYGNITIISHKNNVFTVYAHARKNFAHKGQRVYRGQVIAQVGSSGHSTGPHLHFEVRLGERPLDPLNFLNVSKEQLFADLK